MISDLDKLSDDQVEQLVALLASPHGFSPPSRTPTLGHCPCSRLPLLACASGFPSRFAIALTSAPTAATPAPADRRGTAPTASSSPRFHLPPRLAEAARPWGVPRPIPTAPRPRRAGGSVGPLARCGCTVPTMSAPGTPIPTPTPGHLTWPGACAVGPLSAGVVVACRCCPGPLCGLPSGLPSAGTSGLLCKAIRAAHAAQRRKRPVAPPAAYSARRLAA
jgi:hypothetical protein